MDYATVKRGMDIAVSALALWLLLPFLVVIAIIIVLESPGSPLFFQTRIGKGGAPFKIVKFRSMVKDASKIGPYHTAAGDPRITQMGQFIRSTSLDELPQLWNVLTGDMSLVGPRPETPQQKELYNEADWQTRHRVRPGITGLAQVSGRSSLTPEQRLAFDLQYVPSWEMDLDIISKTFMQVLRRVGVN